MRRTMGAWHPLLCLCILPLHYVGCLSLSGLAHQARASSTNADTIRKYAAEVHVKPEAERWPSHDSAAQRVQLLLEMSKSCPLGNLFIPAGVAAIVIFGVLLRLGYYMRDQDLAEGVRCMILLPQFICLVGSTIIVIDSYELAELAGMAPGDSGQLVGLNWGGAALGFTAMWAVLRQRPMVWRECPKSILAVGLSINLLGVSLYLYGVHLVEIGKTGASPIHLLKAARLIGGVGQGLVAQFMVVTIQTVTSKADMRDQMTRVFFINAIGVGAGPIIAGLSHYLAACPAGNFSFKVAPMVQLTLTLAGLVAVLQLFPSMEALVLPESSAPPASATAEDDVDNSALLRRRYLLIAACVAVFVLRNYIASGVEVGSALMLERDYSMDRRVVGLAIGMTFMAAIPVRMLYEQFKDSLSMIGWFRVFACFAIVGAAFLLRGVSQLLPGGAAILMGDSIIFPCAFLADGLSYGVLMVNVFADGSLLDKNHCALYCNGLGMGVGRLCGPWLARYQLEVMGHSGQDSYALAQMLACALSLVIFELGIRPGIK
eukprot:TRINITY_DN110955_c0_g1_i1.p1 TRINITY_DN110955_c0_g1~~TRINITY_DN110955_c0_g1_i1.p1  ORF type:complete len:544 (+),score=68.72 TRINITY_DN110955_c0_g1_i1:98-1729(+)